MNLINIEKYLHTCPELSAFCTQNGWIDNETLQFDVLEQNDRSLVASVTFEEVIVKAAGCVGTRMPCYGRVRIRLAENSDVVSLEVL